MECPAGFLFANAAPLFEEEGRPVFCTWERIVQQDIVAIVAVDMDITARAGDTPQLLRPRGIGIYQVIPENGGVVFRAISGLPSTISPVRLER